MFLIVLALSAFLHWMVDSIPGTSYQANRLFNDGTGGPANLWGDSLRTFMRGPRQGRGPDSGWCYVDPDTNISMLYNIAESNSAGQSKWSNYVIVNARNSMMTYFLERPTWGRDVYTEPRRPRFGILSWSLAKGDTSAYRIVSQTDVQNRLRPTICAIYGYWIDGNGVRQPCAQPQAVMRDTMRVLKIKRPPTR